MYQGGTTAAPSGTMVTAAGTGPSTVDTPAAAGPGRR